MDCWTKKQEERQRTLMIFKPRLDLYSRVLIISLIICFAIYWKRTDWMENKIDSKSNDLAEFKALLISRYGESN